MKRLKPDPEREERIHNEAIVDARPGRTVDKLVLLSSNMMLTNVDLLGRFFAKTDQALELTRGRALRLSVDSAPELPWSIGQHFLAERTASKT